MGVPSNEAWKGGSKWVVENGRHRKRVLFGTNTWGGKGCTMALGGGRRGSDRPYLTGKGGVWLGKRVGVMRGARGDN